MKWNISTTLWWINLLLSDQFHIPSHQSERNLLHFSKRFDLLHEGIFPQPLSFCKPCTVYFDLLVPGPSQNVFPSTSVPCVAVVDPWEDIHNDAHRRFIRGYLKVWPYPPMADYGVGEQLNVECEGVQRACEVLHTDCSLMHVLFKVSVFLGAGGSLWLPWPMKICFYMQGCLFLYGYKPDCAVPVSPFPSIADSRSGFIEVPCVWSTWSTWIRLAGETGRERRRDDPAWVCIYFSMV